MRPLATYRYHPGSQIASFVLGLVAAVGAQANPQGAQVVHGTVTFAAPTPQTLNITNSPNAILNWQAFDIGVGETTRFIQQNAASAVLNRVVTGNSSDILGNLLSNGRVFLINPAGILIGREGKVDTAGVVLSTLNLSDANFLAGRLAFEGDASHGAITNHGYIKSGPGGEIILIAPRIENVPEAGAAKSGLIESAGGDLILAAGHAITIASLDDPDISFEVRAPETEVINLGRLLADGGTASVLAGTIRHSGELRANTLSRDARGRIVLRASEGVTLEEGSVVSASGGAGGSVSISAENADSSARVYQMGSVRADGRGRGGEIEIEGDRVFLTGDVSANGRRGGGDIAIEADEELIATAGADLTAHGGRSRGGHITLDGGKGAFVSSAVRATGNRGGTVHVLGREVTLAAAQIDASGRTAGGDVRIGGGKRGGEGLRAARLTEINDATVIRADATHDGDGGDVAVWAKNATRFGGTITARGGRDGGDGGAVEVSAKRSVRFGGEVLVTAVKGVAGALSMDPKNIIFTNEVLPGRPYRLLDPHPGAGNLFGQNIEFFDAAGNQVGGSSAITVVVRDPLDDFGGDNAGAVYVYRLSDGALLSGLHGLHGGTDGDRAGENPLNIVNGEWYLRTQKWNSNTGAITPFDPVNGTSGPISDSNSLVGANPGDFVGDRALQNLGGGFVAARIPNFGGGLGAVTVGTLSEWKAGTVVGTSNSLVGANTTDFVGNGFLQNFGNGNYYLRTNHGGFGAVTVIAPGDASRPWRGQVSSTNSFVGTTNTDAVGNFGIQDFGTHYAIRSPNWNNNAGALTFASTTTGIVGEVDGSLTGNSLVGANAGDFLSSNNLQHVGGGKYVLRNPHGGFGAVTWVDPTAAPVGAVSNTNSFVGTNSTDDVGGSGVTILNGGFYAIRSPSWNNSTGALTIANAATGIVGEVDGTAVTGNSLVGSTTGDSLSSNALNNLDGNGRYVLVSTNGGFGAVTYIVPGASPVGPTANTNSLVGTGTGDQVGSGGVGGVLGNMWVVFSPSWDASLVETDAGAVTLFDASTGNFWGTTTPLQADLSSGNSLAGSTQNDQVGSGGIQFAYTGSTQSYLAVLSPDWNAGPGPAPQQVGAITWTAFSDPLNGVVSSLNSLVGQNTGDRIGAGNTFVGQDLGFSTTGVYTFADFEFSNRNALFYSPTYNSGGGAFVFLPDSGPTVGVIGNPGVGLFGGTAGDDIGSSGVIVENGYYMILSPLWDNGLATDAGAVTIASTTAGVAGAVAGVGPGANSLVGDQNNDRVGEFVPEVLPGTGARLLHTQRWHGFTGAVTYLNLVNGNLIGDTDFVGVVDDTNSLVGNATGDNTGGGDLRVFGNGNYLVISPDADEFGGPGVNFGALTFGSGSTGVAGFISSANSLTGSNDNDFVGNGTVTALDTGALLIASENWNGSRGTQTYLDITTGRFGGAVGDLAGIVDETNSLVGVTANDNVGFSIVRERHNTGIAHFILFNPDVDNGSSVDAGAITIGRADTGVVGFVDDASVSFLGSNDQDRIGLGANFEELENGNLVLLNPQWGNFKGTATFVDLVNETGLAGVIDDTNSVVGSTSDDGLTLTVNEGDQVGSGELEELDNNVFAIQSPEWNADRGAITWGDIATGVSGVVSAANSLVGTSADDFLTTTVNEGDRVGDCCSIDFVTSGLYVVDTPNWNNGRSALTFVPTAGVLPTGAVDASKSIVGTTPDDFLTTAEEGDNLGSGGIFTVGSGANRRVVIWSPQWDNTAVAGSAIDAGAITTFPATTPITGPLDNTNSLVGTHGDDVLTASINEGDRVGSGYQVFLSNGSRLFVTQTWHLSRGAITHWDLNSDLVGDVSATTSLVGANGDDPTTLFTNEGDQIGSFNIGELGGTGRFYVRAPDFDQDRGALAFGSITTGVRDTLGPSNALVGANPNDRLSNTFLNFLGAGRFVQLGFHGGRGSVTWINPADAPTGVAGPTNSLVGTTTTSSVGSHGIQPLDGVTYAVLSGFWDATGDENQGAITFFTGSTGLIAGTSDPLRGAVSEANSLVGDLADDRVGRNFIRTVPGPSFMRYISSDHWHNDTGALTWYTDGSRLTGRITPQNSLVGSNPGDGSAIRVCS